VSETSRPGAYFASLDWHAGNGPSGLPGHHHPCGPAGADLGPRGTIRGDTGEYCHAPGGTAPAGRRAFMGNGPRRCGGAL